MKSPVCLSVLAVLGLFSCDLFGGATDVRPFISSTRPDAAEISSAEDGPVASSSEFMIPGPLRSLLRMAGISPKIAPEQVLPLLSRNVFIQGYEGSRKQTEFLILLSRYVVQAKELSNLVGADGRHSRFQL